MRGGWSIAAAIASTAAEACRSVPRILLGNEKEPPLLMAAPLSTKLGAYGFGFGLDAFVRAGADLGGSSKIKMP